MSGACVYEDEATKHVICCGSFTSYKSFKILAWIYFVNFSFEFIISVMFLNDIFKVLRYMDFNGFGLLLVYFVFLAIVILSSAGFVFKDSATTRKFFVAGLVLAGLFNAVILGRSGIIDENESMLGINALALWSMILFALHVYWANEMYKLAKIAEEGIHSINQKLLTKEDTDC